VGGGDHEHDRKDQERGGTRPAGEREREREVTARTDGGRLEASQHADTTRQEGRNERQQPQQQQQPKPRPKLQLKLQPKR